MWHLLQIYKKSLACYKSFQHHVYKATCFGMNLGIFGFWIIYVIKTEKYIYLLKLHSYMKVHLSLFHEVLSFSSNFLYSPVLCFPSSAITILLDKTELRIQGKIMDHQFICGSNIFSVETWVSSHSVSIQQWIVEIFLL